MSSIHLQKEKALEVSCATGIFHIYEGDDGTLYIEALNTKPLKIAVSDEDDPGVEAYGQWVNITIVPARDQEKT